MLPYIPLFDSKSKLLLAKLRNLFLPEKRWVLNVEYRRWGEDKAPGRATRYPIGQPSIELNKVKSVLDGLRLKTLHQRSFSKKEDNELSCFHRFSNNLSSNARIWFKIWIYRVPLSSSPQLSHLCSFVHLGSLLSNRVKSQSILRLEKRSITNTILGNSLTISSTIQLINTNVLIQNYWENRFSLANLIILILVY